MCLNLALEEVTGDTVIKKMEINHFFLFVSENILLYRWPHFFFLMKASLFIYLFIFGCVGSSFLCEGFL